MITYPYTWIELNKHAFFNNIAQYKKAIGDTTLSIVVKANAYGHGLKEMAQLCQKNKDVDWLCVVSLSEALTLRAHNFTKHILVLNLIDENPAAAIKNNIDLTVYDEHNLKALNELGSKLQKPVNIHLKIDTGLSRFGFFPEQALKVIEYTHGLPFINLRGIFTHCAEADAQDQTFTKYQLEQFHRLLTALEKINIHIPHKHAFNSAATTTYPLGLCNFVRVGAGVYGLWPSENNKKLTQKKYPDFQLQPVLTWKTKILDMKSVPAGSFISYNRTFQTQRNSTLAFLPIGYYEGYDRQLSNCGLIGIHKADLLFYAPVVGRVCMNTTIIDVTEVPGIKIGDEVILLGPHQNLTAVDLADKIKSYNPREIVTRLNPAIPRIQVNIHKNKILPYTGKSTLLIHKKGSFDVHS